ncbi:uncharacterized protein LOC106881823 [Octopus bimaculoides]|uniref:uncharacterized protein LOC106881823 n=1 Tax=Octopus bimaculoides TaxID=37653 RepID=UPI0022E850D8|nr:uncharacterized protein LOC106881823 [Octopus bimaculoides]
MWTLGIITITLISHTLSVGEDYLGYGNQDPQYDGWNDNGLWNYGRRNNSYSPMVAHQKSFRQYPSFPRQGSFFGDFSLNGEWGYFRLWKQPEYAAQHKSYEPQYHGHNFFEDFARAFKEMCCRFEDRFLKNFANFGNNYQEGKRSKLFLLDLSSQMSPDELSHIKESLTLMVDNMCLPKSSTRTFDHTVDVHSLTLITNNDNVKQYHSETKSIEQLKEAIHKLNGHDGVSCVTSLLKKAYTHIDKYTDGSKTRIKYDVLLITDGRSTCRSSYYREAWKLRSVAHVSVLTIIKRDQVTNKKIKITDIASDSSTDNVYSFRSCNDFLGMMKHINTSPCKRCPAI